LIFDHGNKLVRVLIGEMCMNKLLWNGRIHLMNNTRELFDI